MNETERDRILKMVSEGMIRPNEAAHLLAALADDSKDAPAKSASSKTVEAKAETAEKEKPKPQTMEVQMQRPDGSHYTVELPASLVPMIMKMAGVAIKESARTASKEAWDGFKTMVKNKATEVTTNVKTKVTGDKTKSETVAPVSALTPEQEGQAEARRRILQMIQNGRLTANDASLLIQQLDQHYAAQQPPKPDSPVSKS